MQLGVHSEIGKLRKVMVSRPSLAHERLTPGNCHDLLFDDVIWVQKARSDHADFVLKMKDRGIEVYDIQDLLTDIFRDSPEARAFVLDRRITPNQVGPALARILRPWLDELDPHQLARHLLGGVVYEDLPPELITPLMREALSATEFIVKPVPNSPVPARPLLLDLRRRHLQPDVLAGAQDRGAAPARGLQVPPGLHQERVRDSGGATATRTGATPRWRAATSCRSARASS